VIEAGPGRLREDQAVVILSVRSLQIQAPGLVAVRLTQADHLHVMTAGSFQIGDVQADVADAADGHRELLRWVFWCGGRVCAGWCGRCRRRRLRRVKIAAGSIPGRSGR
jgi:hypothetical protein